MSILVNRMNFLCETKKLIEAISNTPDRERFLEFFTGQRSIENMPGIVIEIPEAKTRTQNGTVWRDWAIAGKLLYTSKEAIYYLLQTAEEFRDVWFNEVTYGPQHKVTYEIKTLSKLSKNEIAELIPRYRDYLQTLINNEYGQYIIINWSKQENINKPDYEI